MFTPKWDIYITLMQTPHISKAQGPITEEEAERILKQKDEREECFEELSSGFDVTIAHRSSQQNLNKSRWPNSEIDGDSAAL